MSSLLVLGTVIVGAMIIARIITKTAKWATTVQCSACKERVKVGASKCRYCGTLFG